MNIPVATQLRSQIARLQAASIVLIAASAVMTIIELVNPHFFFRKGREAPQLQHDPAVSIIKALKGIDATGELEARDDRKGFVVRTEAEK